MASEADDIDEFLDATDGERENKRAAAVEMGRQHLEEVHQQQEPRDISKYLRKVQHLPSSTPYISRGIVTDKDKNDDQHTDEQKRKKAISNIGFKLSLIHI